MRFTSIVAALSVCLANLAGAQQYAGDSINTSLPVVPGSEIAYWKIKDGLINNLTLINYISRGSDGNRLQPAKIKRLVVVIHGLNRDPGTYMSNMISALSQSNNKEINLDSVAIVAPYFANGDDKDTGGYPWVAKLPAGQGSITNALVWKGSQWSGGGNNQYPYKNTITSSYTVLDQIIQYFDNAATFPNLNQIVIAGHSLGAQTVQRYAAIGNQLGTRSPVSYWVGNPNSYVWMSTSRPLSTTSCPTYDYYRDGYTNFTEYPMTYGQSLVTSGRPAILANFNSKAVNYARGTQDIGDDSTSCAPFTAGANRNERFFNFIKAFPVSCPDPAGRNCDTVDFINAGHDGNAMFSSQAGLTRLFYDNWSGNGSRAYDFGYPRQQTGDDPFPDLSLNTTSASINNNTYAGNMTYWGCWSDQTPASLTNLTYMDNTNTIERCSSVCAQGGYTIAGVEYGTQCFCGNSLGYQAQQVIDTSCSVACSGNSSEICGGSNRLSLFSNGRPVVLSTPGSPETVANDFYYTNCYTEATNGHALTGPSTSGSFMTLEYCGAYCKGYQYFGTEYASECYCGNSLAAGSTIAAAGDCNMLCAADSTEFCGAGNRLTLYKNSTYVASSSVSSSASSITSLKSTGTSASIGITTLTGSLTSTGITTSATPVSCPASNGQTILSNGKNFTVECGIDHSGGDLSAMSISSFQSCIDACAQNSQCVDVSYTSTCYLKSTLGGSVANGGVWGAKLAVSSSPSSVSTTTSTLSTSIVSGSQTGSTASTPSTVTVTATSFASASASATPVSCPGSDGLTVVSNGLSFVIECGIDHQGGDLSSLSVSSFQQCVDACASNTACMDAVLSGGACYLKHSVGARVTNGVYGARLLVSSTSSVAALTASSSSSPVPTTSRGSSATTSVSSVSQSTSSTASSGTTSSATSASTSSSASASATPLSCPSSNGNTYVSGGLSFLIECGVDHAGGDMGSLSVSSFEACIAACTETSGCVDVALSGSACYLKSSVGAAVTNGVLGATLIAASSTSSVASSTPSSVSSSSESSSSSTITASSAATSLSATPSSSAATSSSVVSSLSVSSIAASSLSVTPSSSVTTSSNVATPSSVASSSSAASPSSVATSSSLAASSSVATISSSSVVIISSSSSVALSSSTDSSTVAASSFAVASTSAVSSTSTLSSSTETPSSSGAAPSSDAGSSSSAAVSSTSIVTSSSSTLATSSSVTVSPLSTSSASSSAGTSTVDPPTLLGTSFVTVSPSSTSSSSVLSTSSAMSTSSVSMSSVGSASVSDSNTALSTNSAPASATTSFLATSPVAKTTTSVSSSSASSTSSEPATTTSMNLTSSSMALSTSSVSSSSSITSSSFTTSITSSSQTSVSSTASSSVASASSLSASSLSVSSLASSTLSTLSSSTFSTITVSSTTTTSSTSSASAAATTLSCPGSNSTFYTTPQGQNFLIECGIDHSGGDLTMVYVSSFTACVNACSTTTGCVDVSLSGAACYMKSKVGASITNSGVRGAKLITT